MSYRKDYRKTPAQNHREAIEAKEGKKTIKEWLLIGGIGVLLVSSIVWFSGQINTMPTVTTKENKAKVVKTAARKAKKERIIANSYEEVMTLGDVITEIDDHKEAANHYFDAKTIYPYKIEPRVALTESYFERCKAGRKHDCLRTARELMYARMYMNDDTSPELVKQLDALQRELDQIYTVKDSAMLYVH